MGFDYNAVDVTLDELVNHSIVIVTDDFNGVTGPWVAKQFQLDEIEEGIITELNKNFKPREKCIIVDRKSVEKTLKSLHEDALIFIKREKNDRFKTENNLSKSDLRDILTQLSVKDYSYSIKSKHKQFLGDMLTVFITGKDFKLKDGCSINNLVLYIKVEDSSEGFVTIISIHESENPNEESHPYIENVSFNTDFSDLEKTHNKYSYTFDVICELGDFSSNIDSDEAEQNSGDAISDSLDDLVKEMIKIINSRIPQSDVKINVIDSDLGIDEDSWFTADIYINSDVDSQTADIAINNCVDCVGLGSNDFETTNYSDSSYVSGPNIPNSYSGWSEYGYEDAYVESSILITAVSKN